MSARINKIGFYGGIFIREHFYEKAGQTHQGHAHNKDHISILTQGSIKAEIKGSEPKIFKAPTFIVIKKELWHKFTALEDNTFFYCVFSAHENADNVKNIHSFDETPYSLNYDSPEMSIEEVEKMLGISSTNYD